MHNKHEAEPKKYEADLKSKMDYQDKMDPKVDSLKVDSEKTDPKVDSPKVDSENADPKVDSLKVDCDDQQKSETDYDNNSSQPKVNLKITSNRARRQKKECSQTNKENRPSRSCKRSAASERCLRSNLSTCNKKPKSDHASRNSVKAGKVSYDLSDLIRDRGRAKPKGKPRPRPKPKVTEAANVNVKKDSKHEMENKVTESEQNADKPDQSELEQAKKQ